MFVLSELQADHILCTERGKERMLCNVFSVIIYVFVTAADCLCHVAEQRTSVTVTCCLKMMSIH